MTLTYTKPIAQTPQQMIMNHLEDIMAATGGPPRLTRPPAYTPLTLEGLLANEASGEQPPEPAVDPTSGIFARLGLEAPPSIDYAAGNRKRIQNGQPMFATENPLTLNNLTPPPAYEPVTLEGLIANEQAARRNAVAANTPARQRNPNEPPPYEAPVGQW